MISSSEEIGTEYKYRIFNILTNQIIEIESDTKKLETLINYLITYKNQVSFHTDLKHFIANNLEIQKKYL